MLKLRVVTAMVLLAGFLAAMVFLDVRLWTLLTAAVVLIAAFEWAHFGKFSRSAAITYVIATAGLCAVLIIFGRLGGLGAMSPPMLGFYGVALIFWLLFVPVWLRYGRAMPSRPTMAVLGWVVLIPAWVALVELRQTGPITLLQIMALVWVADIAAYFSGRKFGKHKLAPHISPGKTWEGVAGAFVCVLIYASIAEYALPVVKLDGFGQWLLFGMVVLALTAMSIVGDLFESGMKRYAGLKDSGNILPGHGGVLDRIDGLLSVLPLAALIFYFSL